MNIDDPQFRLPLTPRPIGEDGAHEWEGRITFDECVALAARYYRRVVGSIGVELGELARELTEAIKQLDFLLKSSYVLHRQYFGLMKDGGLTPEEFVLYRYTAFVLDLYATMFYYVGHRAQVILRDRKHRLPGIESYRQAKGVQKVRNDVLEHPRPDEFTAMGGSAGHSQYGPLVRSTRDGKGLSDDSRWLFKDAEQLESVVRDVLVRAHVALDRDPLLPTKSAAI
jgi:hypothetical protein